MRYNSNRWKHQPEMHENIVILNLQNFKRDSYYFCNMSGLRIAVEDRKADAVAHLALARSQNTGNGILGYFKRAYAESS